MKEICKYFYILCFLFNKTLECWDYLCLFIEANLHNKNVSLLSLMLQKAGGFSISLLLIDIPRCKPRHLPLSERCSSAACRSDRQEAAPRWVSQAADKRLRPTSSSSPPLHFLLLLGRTVDLDLRIKKTKTNKREKPPPRFIQPDVKRRKKYLKARRKLQSDGSVQSAAGDFTLHGTLYAI